MQSSIHSKLVVASTFNISLTHLLDLGLLRDGPARIPGGVLVDTEEEGPPARPSPAPLCPPYPSLLLPLVLPSASESDVSPE